ncbi:hypothetical protein HNR16_002384 [Pseudoclavibacter chungangensis]|nr:hypothetical protein [Pseudoclavibacter chungangensis]
MTERLPGGLRALRGLDRDLQIVDGLDRRVADD